MASLLGTCGNFHDYPVTYEVKFMKCW